MHRGIFIFVDIYRNNVFREIKTEKTVKIIRENKNIFLAHAESSVELNPLIPDPNQYKPSKTITIK